MQKKFEEEIRKRHLDFKELMKLRINCNKNLLNYLAYISEKNYKNQKHYYETCDYQNEADKFISTIDLDILTHRNDDDYIINYYFLIDELTNFIEQSKR